MVALGLYVAVNVIGLSIGDIDIERFIDTGR